MRALTPEEYESLFGETRPPAPQTQASPVAPPPSLPPPPNAPGANPTKSPFRRKRVLIPAGVLGLALIGSLLSEPDGVVDTASVTPTSASTVEEIVSSTTTPEIPEPSSATVEPLLEQLQVSDQELLQALTQINEAETVESFDPATDYERSSYTGDGWPDSDGDCQSDRHEILIDLSLIHI